MTVLTFFCLLVLFIIAFIVSIAMDSGYNSEKAIALERQRREIEHMEARRREATEE